MPTEPSIEEFEAARLATNSSRQHSVSDEKFSVGLANNTSLYSNTCVHGNSDLSEADLFSRPGFDLSYDYPNSNNSLFYPNFMPEPGPLPIYDTFDNNNPVSSPSQPSIPTESSPLSSSGSELFKEAFLSHSSASSTTASVATSSPPLTENYTTGPLAIPNFSIHKCTEIGCSRVFASRNWSVIQRVIYVNGLHAQGAARRASQRKRIRAVTRTRFITQSCCSVVSVVANTEKII